MPGKILVVDDEPDVQEVLARMIGSRGFVVETAGTRAEALAAYQPGAYVLVLIDQCLSDGYGWEVAEDILLKDPAAKVLMMSGHLDPLEEAEAHPGGILGWIEKPFTVPELLALVEKRLGHPLN